MNDWDFVAILTGCEKMHGAQGRAPSIPEMCQKLLGNIHMNLIEKGHSDLVGMGLESIIGSLLLRLNMSESALENAKLEANSKLEGTIRKLECASKRVVAADEKCSALFHDLEEEQKQTEQLSEQLNKANSLCDYKDSEIIKLGAQIKAAHRSRNEAQERCNATNRKMEEMQSEIDRLRNERNNAIDIANAANDYRVVEQLRKELEEMKLKFDCMSEALKETDEEWNERGKEINRLNCVVFNFRRENGDLKEEYRKLQGRLSVGCTIEMAEKIAKLAQENADLKLAKEEINRQVAARIEHAIKAAKQETANKCHKLVDAVTEKFYL